MKINGNKVVAIAAAFSLGLSSWAFAGEGLTDIAGNPNEEAIKTLHAAGIVAGEPDGSFKPMDNLNRAKACIMVVKAINPESAIVKGTATQSVSKAGFKDMKGYGWAESYVSYAVKAGIVKGYPDGSFKPGAEVSGDELIAMTLRAIGTKEEEIGKEWPTDYRKKAEELGILKSVGVEGDELAKPASKAMAAQMVANKLNELKAMAPKEEPKPQGTDKDKSENVPSAGGMEFTNAGFDSAMTTFAGKKISPKAEIYTMGLRKEYKKDMELSKKAEDYTKTTVYKYKNTKTPAWYMEENNEIVKMILPKDVGYSGYIHCVINETSTTVGPNGEKSVALHTLTAGRELIWLCEEKMAAPALAQDGKIYELIADNGMISEINSQENHKFKKFDELEGSAWKEIKEYKNGLIITKDDKFIPTKERATVYEVEEKGGYSNGRLDSLREGQKVRAYDISDDKEDSADLVVVK